MNDYINATINRIEQLGATANYDGNMIIAKGDTDAIRNIIAHLDAEGYTDDTPMARQIFGIPTSEEDPTELWICCYGEDAENGYMRAA